MTLWHHHYILQCCNLSLSILAFVVPQRFVGVGMNIVLLKFLDGCVVRLVFFDSWQRDHDRWLISLKGHFLWLANLDSRWCSSSGTQVHICPRFNILLLTPWWALVYGIIGILWGMSWLKGSKILSTKATRLFRHQRLRPKHRAIIRTAKGHSGGLNRSHHQECHLIQRWIATAFWVVTPMKIQRVLPHQTNLRLLLPQIDQWRCQLQRDRMFRIHCSIFLNTSVEGLRVWLHRTPRNLRISDADWHVTHHLSDWHCFLRSHPEFGQVKWDEQMAAIRHWRWVFWIFEQVKSLNVNFTLHLDFNFYSAPYSMSIFCFKFQMNGNFCIDLDKPFEYNDMKKLKPSILQWNAPERNKPYTHLYLDGRVKHTQTRILCLENSLI